MSDRDDDDLSEFHGVFFEEVDEHLAALEGLLLSLDLAAPDQEQLDAIFRAAHSIKGGSAVFGFDDSAALTHEMETLFDRVRKGGMPLTTAVVDTFLASGDLLEAMFAARRALGANVPSDAIETQCAQLRRLGAASSTVDSGVEAPTDPAARSEPAAQPRSVLVTLGPLAAHETVDAFDGAVATLRGFGPVSETGANDDEDAVRYRRLAVVTAETVQRIAEALEFFVDPRRTRVETRDHDPLVAAPEAPAASPAVPREPKPTAPVAAPTDDTSSIRVGITKVDQLINLVGELVITQAMLEQTASTFDPAIYEALAHGLSQLQRNTRDLQEAAMSIRMMPMSTAFNRFPRMVRDTAARLDKAVELRTIGEATELDKGLIERIVDPLTHLVRNSLDHGIESPAERVALGKPEKGVLTLKAYHQGGAIVIEVSDDGRGLARDRIVAKARERGIDVADNAVDAEVWQLIFAPGFSTAATVTDVSGRGVGMDVVKRNIQSLGGRVDLDSRAGAGTRITIRLPLTLAILDGLSVGVGDEQFIVPLSCIVESLQPSPADLKTVAGRGRLVHVRGEYLPVLALHELFDIAPCVRDAAQGILVILETEGRKTALLVDTLAGQHQVVIKSLESNYRRVRGVSGATIMGDGKVALILDANALADMATPLLAAA